MKLGLKLSLLTSVFVATHAVAEPAVKLPVGASNCSILMALAPKLGANCKARNLGKDRGIVLRLDKEIQDDPPEITIRKTSPSLTARKPLMAKPKPVRKPVKVASAQPRIDRAAAKSSNGYFIQFAFASFDLEPDYVEHLDRLATVLSSEAMQETCIRVTGHTDTIGAEDKNKKLSENRAVMVASYLAEKGEINPDRIQIAAAGETRPLPDIKGTDSLNRRVEFSTKEALNGCS